MLGLRHSYCAPSRLVTTAYCTWRWCLGYGTATLHLRAKCLLLTAPGVGAWATAQLRCGFALGVYSLLQLALVLRLRHSYDAPSRLVYSGYCTWRWCLSYGPATVRLRACLSSAYSTWRWCFGYGTATVRIRSKCLHLTPRDDGALDAAQLRCACARSDGSILHLALMLGLRHSYGAPSRLVSSGYCTWRWFLVYGTTTIPLRAWCLQLTPPGVGS